MIGVEHGGGGLDGQPAAAGHRVPGVHDEVHEDLLELAGIDEDVQLLAAQRELQLHVLTDQPLQHPERALDEAADVEHLRLDHLPARERQELLRERGRALGRVGPATPLGILVDSILEAA